MKKALEMLGYDPCYHMFEVVDRPERKALWLQAAKGILPDWDATFEDYQATVDWPAAYFWRELSAHFPDAKILLTVRSSQSWYASMNKTILASLRSGKYPDGLGTKLVGERVFGGRFEEQDKAHVIDTYEQNIAKVQASFDATRLLTYELGSGWEPLCAFLGCDIPKAPYPSSNATAAFRERMGMDPA